MSEFEKITVCNKNIKDIDIDTFCKHIDNNKIDVFNVFGRCIEVERFDLIEYMYSKQLINTDELSDQIVHYIVNDHLELYKKMIVMFKNDLNNDGGHEVAEMCLHQDCFELLDCMIDNGFVVCDNCPLKKFDMKKFAISSFFWYEGLFYGPFSIDKKLHNIMMKYYDKFDEIQKNKFCRAKFI